ncbi:MAG: hypothetical protein ABW292_00785, partial [Vicinamibacterales bacterium]
MTIVVSVNLQAFEQVPAASNMMSPRIGLITEIPTSGLSVDRSYAQIDSLWISRELMRGPWSKPGTTYPMS